jgi:hypothetical protein
MLILNGFFKDNRVVPEHTVSVPDGTRAIISVEEDTPEQAFKLSLDPRKQLGALKKFHEDLNAIDDEPLDEEFDRAVNAGLKFTQVDF